jgi:hypothetical protein
MSDLFARCEGCNRAINYGEGIAFNGRLRHKQCIPQVSTEPQGALQGEPEKPGETGGPRCTSRQTDATQVRPSWLFPMDFTTGRRPDAQEDGGVREGDFFEGLRS